MMLQINEQTRIEDPREYGAEVVNSLRDLLIAGGCAHRDLRRENFYDLEDGGNSFYIHISPVDGHVMLVARWSNSLRETCASVANLSA